MKKQNFDSLLSPLENDVLKIVWPDKNMRVRQIYAKLKLKRKVALSSVAVILDRLCSRGVVSRRIEHGRGGARYIYYPTKNRKAFEKSVVEETVDKLIEKFGATALSYFNKRFSKRR